MIETDGLTKRYSDDFIALDSLSLSIAAGEVFGYIGPNGAGKTTTIRILCGLLRPSSGTAFVDGHDATSDHTIIRQLTGYLPDAFGVYEEMRVWEYLDFFGACFNIPRKVRQKRIDEVLEITGVQAMRDYFVDTLSRGMHQRVGIAKTLLHDPKVVFLDEPANGLDPRARIDMRHLIRRLAEMGKTVLVSSHILPELASICDKVGIIERGRLLAYGSVEDIMHQVRPNRRVAMEFIGDPAPVRAAAAVLSAKGAIGKSEVFDNLLQFELSGDEAAVSGILRHLMDAGIRVVWFREEPGDLEEAFMQVTEGAAAGARQALSEAEELAAEEEK